MSDDKTSLTLRPLCRDDFGAVAALDRRCTGRARSAYLERRLQAALRVPKHHLQVAAELEGRLVGFVLARLVAGEFGRTETAALLETIAVDPDEGRHGVGRALLGEVESLARHKGARELATEAAWNDRDVLAFLHGSGFELAPRQVIECDVDRLARV